MKTQLIALSVLGLSVCGQASAVLIDDTYWGADGFTSLSDRDRIGDSRYEVYSMDVSFNSGYMNVRVNTNFSTPDRYGVDFGDLFISTDGWSPNSTTSHYRSDNISILGNVLAKYCRHTNGNHPLRISGRNRIF